MTTVDNRRINPLSRRPRGKRLVIAVRGAAGAGKSVFAASLAQAGQGRLCFFDTERKARLLTGSDGSAFDAIEIQHPDELPAFIDWALDGEGRMQNYGCYALDSWALYFARKHRETIKAVRERTGDPTAQPSAEALASDQALYQEVLRRLCVDSGACVVITDQIGARGKEEREENERGRVLPMTTGGLEYFVDVMVELEVRQKGFEQVRVARVVKSNSAPFPIGLEVEDPSFADFLDRMDDRPEPEPVAPELAAPEAPASEAEEEPSLDQLIEHARAFGISRAQLITAAYHYCGVSDLDRLTPPQVGRLAERMLARYGEPRETGTTKDRTAQAKTKTMPVASQNGRTLKKAA